MIFQRRFLFWKTARIILEDEALKDTIENRRYSYVTGLSYNSDLFVGDNTVSQKKKLTAVLPLSGFLDEDLLMRASETTRNEIRRALKTPELSFELPTKKKDAIYELYAQFEREGGRPVRKKSYVERSILGGAWLQGRLIAGIIVYDSFPYLRINAIISLRNTDKEISKIVGFATRALVFELMRFGRDKNYELVDLGGINTQEEKKKGITAFKMSFGAKEKADYMYTYKSTFFRYANFIFHKRG